ncbi:hypothetical protein Tco_1532470 [Tanacetum coccineum]
MKRGFRGVPRPLLPAMFPVVAVDQSAGPADQQPSPEHQPLSPRQETKVPQSQDPTHPHVPQARTMISGKLTSPGSQFDHKCSKEDFVNLYYNLQERLRIDKECARERVARRRLCKEDGRVSKSEKEVLCRRKRHKVRRSSLDPITAEELLVESFEESGTWKHLTQIDDKDVSVKEKVTEVKEEEPVIRTGKRKKQKARKGINVDKSPQGDSETDEEESVEAMNPTPLDTKSNIVANWKIFQQGERSIYQIIRANGADTVYMSFGAMLKDFTREDLIELYRLVMQKYGTNRPEDVYDRVLWSDLRTMFDPPLNEDAIWSLPLQQKIISWRYYDKCEVHCLTLEACSIYMLADRKYPLSKDACQVMLKMKLLDGKMNEVCYKLLKMIEKQAGIQDFGPTGIVETTTPTTSSMTSRGGVPAETINCCVSNACIHSLLKKRIMTSIPKCGALRDAVGGWDSVQMMSLYCQISAADERNFSGRLSDLLQEMINAYDKKVEFIRELEAVPGITAAVKTGEFLNENLWKDDKRIRKLHNMNINAGMKADEMENFIHKL